MLLGCHPQWLWPSCGLATAILSVWWRASYKFALGTLQTGVIGLLKLYTINLGGRYSNVHSLSPRNLVHHGSEIQHICMEASAVEELRLACQNGSLEGGLVYPNEKQVPLSMSA